MYGNKSSANITVPSKHLKHVKFNLQCPGIFMDKVLPTNVQGERFKLKY
jgi:hypothetical protein